MTEPTLEMTRLRELRKASQDLIELMVADGWLEADSHGIALLEEGWLTLWREYTDRFEALEGADAKNDLFGKMHDYFPGQVFYGESFNRLTLGDCIEDCHGNLYKIVADENGYFIFKGCHTTTFSTPWNKSQKIKETWRYMGNNVW